MKKINFFTALFCTALLFAACDKNDEPKDGLNNNDPKNDTKEAVDLGLSVKWATCNVGATSPEKYGNYYAWGETTTKSDYSWDTYKHKCDTDTLVAADDVATVNWGGAWRMPTHEEWNELIDNCTWTWTILNGVNGCEIKATNGNSIFLPAAGYRDSGNLRFAGCNSYYWSSTLIRGGIPSITIGAYFNLIDVETYYNHDLCYGRTVRPVCK